MFTRWCFSPQEYYISQSMGCNTWGIKLACLLKKLAVWRCLASFIAEVVKHARNKAGDLYRDGLKVRVVEKPCNTVVDLCPTKFLNDTTQ